MLIWGPHRSHSRMRRVSQGAIWRGKGNVPHMDDVQLRNSDTADGPRMSDTVKCHFMPCYAPMNYCPDQCHHLFVFQVR